MKITILMEGKTEKAFLRHVRVFLQGRLRGAMPKLDPWPYDGRIPKGDKLRRAVRDFHDAADAKKKMREWVGSEERFHPHAAQHDFEAWLLPYWSDIQRLAGHDRSAPQGPAEAVNHDKPPAKRIAALFEAGTCRDSYVKVRDAEKILSGKDLTVAAGVCPELKAFLNTILTLSGGSALP